MGIHGSTYTLKEIHASTMPGVEETSHSEEEVSEEEAPPKKDSGSEFDPEEDDGDADFEPAAKKPVKNLQRKLKNVRVPMLMMIQQMKIGARKRRKKPLVLSERIQALQNHINCQKH